MINKIVIFLQIKIMEIRSLNTNECNISKNLIFPGEKINPKQDL